MSLTEPLNIVKITQPLIIEEITSQPLTGEIPLLSSPGTNVPKGCQERSNLGKEFLQPAQLWFQVDAEEEGPVVDIGHGRWALAEHQVIEEVVGPEGEGGAGGEHPVPQPAPPPRGQAAHPQPQSLPQEPRDEAVVPLGEVEHVGLEARRHLRQGHPHPWGGHPQPAEAEVWPGPAAHLRPARAPLARLAGRPAGPGGPEVPAWVWTRQEILFPALQLVQ